MKYEGLRLTEKHAAAAVIGGAVLGGGGGGAMRDGLETAQLALRIGDISLVPLEDISDDQTILTVSAVGAPAAKERFVRPANYIKAVELFYQQYDIRPGGLITNECGGNATVNGWLQSAVLGIPLIDAPCNGRAHPTGLMGSIGLHRDKNYVSKQIAVGGNPDSGRYVEMAVAGSFDSAAAMVRTASVQAGGIVAVARNPVSAAYAKKNTAIGAISQCIGLGQAMLDASAENAAAAAAQYLNGKILACGLVESVVIETRGGFDVGRVEVACGREVVQMTFWNEYMTIEIGGERLGTFPDLIATLDAKTGSPLTTADIAVGQEVALLWVHRDNLSLGAGMRDPALYKAAEAAVGYPLISYVFKD